MIHSIQRFLIGLILLQGFSIYAQSDVDNETVKPRIRVIIDNDLVAGLVEY